MDHLYILSEQDAGDPPLAPSNLTVTGVLAGAVSLSWEDNADNELGFDIERSGDGQSSWQVIASINAGATAYDDISVLPSTLYSYRVRAYNGGGYSGYSNTVDAMTLTGPSLVLNAQGYKIKGKQVVDLSWSGAGSDDYRHLSRWGTDCPKPNQ